MTPFWLSAGYHSSLSLLPCVGKIGRPKASLEPYICTKLITINCSSRTVYFRQQYPMYKGHTFFFFFQQDKDNTMFIEDSKRF